MELIRMVRVLCVRAEGECERYTHIARFAVSTSIRNQCACVFICKYNSHKPPVDRTLLLYPFVHTSFAYTAHTHTHMVISRAPGDDVNRPHAVHPSQQRRQITHTHTHERAQKTHVYNTHIHTHITRIMLLLLMCSVSCCECVGCRRCSRLSARHGIVFWPVLAVAVVVARVCVGSTFAAVL